MPKDIIPCYAKGRSKTNKAFQPMNMRPGATNTVKQERGAIGKRKPGL